MNYNFNVETAERYDVNISILLGNLAHWLTKNKANGDNIIDGMVWTYNSTTAWSKIYPFWSKSQIRRIIDKARDMGAIKTMPYIKDSLNRGLWFTILDDEVFDAKVEESSTCVTESSHSSVTESSHRATESSTYKGTIGNLSVENPVDLYSPSDDGRQPEKQNGKEKGLERFDDFWKIYPRREAKIPARNAWKRHKCDKHYDAIVEDINNRKQDELHWLNKRRDLIPLPASYINAERWTDDLIGE